MHSTATVTVNSSDSPALLTMHISHCKAVPWWCVLSVVTTAGEERAACLGGLPDVGSSTAQHLSLLPPPLSPGAG